MAFFLEKGAFFMTKKSKRWSPTTNMIYERDMTLEMWSLHLYESRILTVWINRVRSGKITPIFIQNVPEYSVWSYFVKEIGLPIFFIKSRIKRIIFRLCSQNYLCWCRSVSKNHLWSSASVQKDYSNILQHYFDNFFRKARILR